VPDDDATKQVQVQAFMPIGDGPPGPETPPAYLVSLLPADPSQMTAILNEMAGQGWRLIIGTQCVLQPKLSIGQPSAGFHCVFQRAGLRM